MDVFQRYECNSVQQSGLVYHACAVRHWYDWYDTLNGLRREGCLLVAMDVVYECLYDALDKSYRSSVVNNCRRVR